MANLVKVRKANRVINVDSTQVKSYLARGYDQIDENGKVEKSATGGKQISPADHNRVLEENANLKEQVALAATTGKASDIDTAEFDQVKSDLEEAKAKITELEDEIKTYEEENERLSKQLKNNKK